jgi:hypothetical protein
MTTSRNKREGRYAGVYCGCHVRGAAGGPRAKIARYFATSHLLIRFCHAVRRAAKMGNAHDWRMHV